jgi:hypothetical protein
MKLIDKRMLYKDSGTIEGLVNGQSLKIRHPKIGPSGFQVYWDGHWYSNLRAGLIDYELGIKVHTKRTGMQKGYPSEAVTRAIWRNLVDRYNNYEPDVKYTP